MFAPSSNTLVLNPDELGPDPTLGMDLAVALGVGELEIRRAFGTNALLLHDGQLRRIRADAEARGLSVRALASPLFKWCREDATADRVDSFGFPTHVPVCERAAHVERALEVAALLGAPLVRVFSNLRVGPDLTESLRDDELLAKALSRAAEVGVALLVENEPACTVSRAKDLLTLLGEYADAGLRVWLDVANLHQVGDADPGLVAALAPYVAYVHVKEYHSGVSGRSFCPAGAGEVPYDALLPVLEEHSPRLPYAIETHVRDGSADAITRSAAYLRRSLRELS